MTPIPSTRVVLGAPLARLNSFSTRPTVRSSSSSSRLNSLSTRPTVKSSSSSLSSTWSFRDRVRVRVSPDFVGGIRMGSTPSEAATAAVTAEDVVVQYVVLRRDLIDTWPLGSVVTQGCHAAVAAVWSHKDDPHTVDYCSPTNIDSMHKVTLEVKGETQLSNLSEKLRAGGIAHKLWIEQPENMLTCLATKPYPKSTVSSFFKKLKLCK